MLRSNNVLMFSLAVSIFGIFTTAFFAFNPTAYDFSFTWRKPLVGAVFAAICVAGMLAAFRPKTCSHILDQHDIYDEQPANPKEKTSYRGHHPDCGRFSAHVVHVKDMTFCAACLGLAVGAFFALAGTAVYFFCGIDFVQADARILLAGQTAVVLGLMQFKLKGYFRLLLNSLFVIGGFMALTEVDKLTANVLIDIYVIAVITVWIFTRIILSQWDHQRICDA